MTSNWSPIKRHADLKVETSDVIKVSNGQSVPYSRWPEWAKAFALVKIENEKGVGDTAHRLFHSKFLGPFSDAIVTGLLTFKKSCGCEKRQADWNTKYPYEN